MEVQRERIAWNFDWSPVINNVMASRASQSSVNIVTLTANAATWQMTQHHSIVVAVADFRDSDLTLPPPCLAPEIVFHSITTKTSDGFIVAKVKQVGLIGGYHFHILITGLIFSKSTTYF